MCFHDAEDGQTIISDMTPSPKLLISFLTYFYFVCISYVIVIETAAENPPVLNHLEQNSVIVITKKSSYLESERTQSDCDKYKCFNPLQCEISASGQVLYYVYPPLTFLNSHDEILYDTKSMITHEYWELLQSLLSKSHRVTSEPDQACIFVPSIDLVWLGGSNVSLIYELYDNLPYWRYVDGKPGTNHLVITLDPMPNIDNLMKVVGRSMLVSSAIDTWASKTSFNYGIPISLESQREVRGDEIRWKLVFTQYSSINSRLRESVNSLERKMDGDFLVLGHYCGENNLDSGLELLKCDQPDSSMQQLDKTTCRCSKDGLTGLRFPQLLSSAQYCLILHLRGNKLLGESSHYLLSQALMRGCVPIISHDFNLPLTGKVRWPEIAILLTNEHSLDNLETLISSIQPDTYQTMKVKARETWQVHFNSTVQLMNNLLDHYDSMVFPKAILNECL